MRSHRANSRRKYITIGIIILGLYIYLTSGYKTFVKEGIIEASPEKVWLFVSDFSKLKMINPTILDFAITADHGNSEHWQYGVDYTEKLSHWPHLLNQNQAHFGVRKSGDSFLVESKHKTCFAFGFYCLHSIGLFEFNQASHPAAVGATHYKETVQYQCPPFMGPLCKREVTFQRDVIFENLRQHFLQNRVRG